MDNSIINLESFNEVAVYGYSHAGWSSVTSLAQQKVINVYDYTATTKQAKTLSGRALTRFTYSDTGGLCKNTLLSIVIENCLRKKEGTSIIPVIFCLTSTSCPTHLPVERIANKNLNGWGRVGKISNAEIRRMYKLCTDEQIPMEVRNVAKETFKFIHFEHYSNLREVCPPWEEMVDVTVVDKAVGQSKVIKQKEGVFMIRSLALFVKKISLYVLGRWVKKVKELSQPETSLEEMTWVEAWELKKKNKMPSSDSYKLNWRKLLANYANACEVVALAQ